MLMCDSVVKFIIALAPPIKLAFSNILDLAFSIKALFECPPIPKIYVAVEVPLTLSTTLKFFLLSSTLVTLLF